MTMLKDIDDEEFWYLLWSTIGILATIVILSLAFSGYKNNIIDERNKTARHEITTKTELEKIKLKAQLIEEGIAPVAVKCLIDDPKGESHVCIAYVANNPE